MTHPPPCPQSQTSGLFRPEDLVEPPKSQRHTYLVAPLFNRVVNQAWEAGTRLVYCVCSRRKLRRSTLREKSYWKLKNIFGSHLWPQDLWFLLQTVQTNWFAPDRITPHYWGVHVRGLSLLWQSNLCGSGEHAALNIVCELEHNI